MAGDLSPGLRNPNVAPPRDLPATRDLILFPVLRRVWLELSASDAR